RFYLARDALAALRVRSPDGRPESVGRRVRDADRVRLVLGADHGRHGAEGLLIERGHPGLHGAEHGGRVEGAPAGGDLATEHESGAALHRLLHLAMQILAQIEPRLWSDLGRWVERIAHPPGAHFAREPLEEPLRHALHHDEALGGDAALA